MKSPQQNHTKQLKLFIEPGRVGIAYHSFRMHAMNLRECGTSEMDGKVLTLNEGMAPDLDRLIIVKHQSRTTPIIQSTL